MKTSLLIVSALFFAVNIFSQTAQSTSVSDSKVIAEADNLLKQGAINEAIKKYTKVVKLLPSNSEAISKRAYAYLQIKDNKSSLDDYNTALALDSTDYTSYSNRALVKWNMIDYPGAIEDCKKALLINSNYYNAYFYMGLAYFETSQYKEAIKCYDKAIFFKGNFVEAMFNRGNAKIELDYTVDACKDWCKAKLQGYTGADANIEKFCKDNACKKNVVPE